MNVHMYEAAATRYNIGKLGIRGAVFVEADEGYLACAMWDAAVWPTLPPSSRARSRFGVKQDLEGKHVVITAGPTVGPIDPVRYISNRSSGKTGYAIARAARRRGADVTLITGPVSIPPLGRPRGAREHRARDAAGLRRGVPFRRYRVVLRSRRRYASGACGGS